MEKIKIELTPVEAQIIRTVFGHATSCPEVKSIYDKVEGHTVYVYTGQLFDFSKIIKDVKGAAMSPLEKLLIANGFKKADNNLYVIQLGYSRIMVDSENGTCAFAGNRLHKISTQADIDKLLHVFSEGV